MSILRKIFHRFLSILEHKTIPLYLNFKPVKAFSLGILFSFFNSDYGGEKVDILKQLFG
jgi:hypothetical protein